MAGVLTNMELQIEVFAAMHVPRSPNDVAERDPIIGRDPCSAPDPELPGVRHAVLARCVTMALYRSVSALALTLSLLWPLPAVCPPAGRAGIRRGVPEHVTSNPASQGAWRGRRILLLVDKRQERV